MADQSVPLTLSIAPFPEGFAGDMDETFQQAVQLMEATVAGAFLSGLVLPPGSTLPGTDVGPVAMGNTWYFWDQATGQYLPQSITARPSKNYVKNASYQIQQTGSAPALIAGVNKSYDLCLTRMTTSGVLTISTDVGPMATSDHDSCPAAIKYTVPNPVPTLAAADIYAHEHLIEGCDLAPIQNEILSLSFLCWVNQAGTYSAYLTNGARDASYCATFTMTTANTWARIKIENIPALPTGTGTWGSSFGEGVTGLYIGVVLGIGSQWQTANTNRWNSGFFAGAAANSNLCAVANNQIKITAMRLEASPQAGYASVNSFEADYQDAIRYYWTSYNYQSTTAGPWGLVLNAFLAGNAAGATLFPRRMAKIPVVTLSSPTTNTGGTLRNITTNAEVTVFGAPAAYSKGINFNGAITTPASAKSDVIIAMVTADARLP